MVFINELQYEMCYGCYYKKKEPLTHNLCQMLDVRSRINYCLIYALDRVDDDAVMTTYAEQVGLAALEWIDAYDRDFRRGDWMNSEKWRSDIVLLCLDIHRTESECISALCINP